MGERRKPTAIKAKMNTEKRRSKSRKKLERKLRKSTEACSFVLVLLFFMSTIKTILYDDLQ